MKRQSGNMRPGTIFEVEAKPIGFDEMIAIVDAAAHGGNKRSCFRINRLAKLVNSGDEFGRELRLCEKH